MTENPSITIIVPSRNEERYIGKCLETLLSQDYKGDYEIIVVDGLSEDATREIVLDYARRNKQVRLLSNAKRITPSALNLGINAARGEIVLVFGGHWHVHEDFLSQIVRLFKKYHVDCMGGLIIREVDNELGHAIELARASLIGGGLSMRNDPTVEEQIIQKPNLAYIWRRTVFEKVGLFDERFVKNQDNEFNLRTIRAGLQTLYSPKIAFHYHASQTFQKLFRQMFSYASFTPMMIFKHRRLLNLSFSVPATALVALIGLIIMGITKVIPVAIPLILMVSYVLIILSAALISGARNKKLRYWPHICISIFTIHIAVALGYLHGVSRLFHNSVFIDLWREHKILSQKDRKVDAL